MDTPDSPPPPEPRPEKVQLEPKPNVLTRWLPSLLLLGLLGLMVFSYSQLNTRMTNLEAAIDSLPQATIDAIVAYQNGERPSQSAQQGSGVSIDNDAFIGDRDGAQFAIIEFSDFNCPYCARFHADTYQRLIDTYVTSGQAIYVYRDYVGVGGDVTHAAAAAAECLREQAGDDAYMALVTQLYASSGTKNEARVKDLASGFDVDTDAFESCIEGGDFRQEIIDDTRAGQAAGLRGTPAFVIGRLAEDGTVTGVSLPGAQPFEVFEQVIEQALAGN